MEARTGKAGTGKGWIGKVSSGRVWTGRVWTGRGSLGLALMLAAGAAWGADGPTTRTGPYIGGSIGAPDVQARATGLAPLDDPDNGSAGRLRAGYWLTRHWGVEASYTRLNGFEQRFASGTFRGRGESYAISGLGRLPFADDWALIGKVSLNTTRVRDDGSTGATAGFEKYRGRGNNVVLPGLALEYAVTDRLSITLEAEPIGAGADKLQLGYGGIGLRWSF